MIKRTIKPYESVRKTRTASNTCTVEVNTLKVADTIVFTFDSNDIEIIDLKTFDKLQLNYKATREFFRDIPFTKALNVHDECITLKQDKFVKVLYYTDANSLCINVQSDDKRYLLSLYVSSYNTVCDVNSFLEASFLNSEIVL